MQRLMTWLRPLVAALFLAGAGQPALAQGATAHASVAGFQLLLPAGWVTVDVPTGLMFVASDMAALEGAGAVPDGARVIFVNAAREELGEHPLGDLVAAFIAEQKLPGAVTSGPAPLAIGGQPASRLEGSGEVDGVRFVFLGVGIESAGRVARIIAIFPQSREDELRPPVEAAIASIVLGEPAP